MSKSTLPSKYDLYERSVQSPEVHVKWFKNMFQELIGKEARALREDFCGTFQLSCEWVKQHPKNTALSLDLDTEPLNYGKKHHYSKLTPAQQKRVLPVQKNVLNPTRPKKDLIIGCNFSFFIFKDRKTLLQYFRNCLKSLNPKGLLVLELAGGPGMIQAMKETKTVPLNQKDSFQYIWHQQSYNPIDRNAHYAIHFKLKNGKVMKDCFKYDWRLWSLPEAREALHEVGFKKTHIYWETEFKGKGTGEYIRTEKGDNAFAWIAYLVGEK